MSSTLKTLGILTSGGDAPGMNAAIRAAVRACSYYNINSLGIYQGYEGLIEGKIKALNARSVANVIDQGGTFLKSARSSAFETPVGRKQAFAQLQKHKIEALIVIGGDGSFVGAQKLSQEHPIALIGIPATIDNDICGTDFTIGFDTAINTVIDAMDKIRDTATSHNRLFFIEVMGRNSGFIAINAGIGSGAAKILIPEDSRDIEHLIESLESSRKTGKSSNIVLVAEGDKKNRVLNLAEAVKKRMPKYDIRVSILGHIQRGGAPSCFDRVLASRMGVAAVKSLIDRKKGLMVGLQNNQITYTPLANAVHCQPQVCSELIEVADIISI